MTSLDVHSRRVKAAAFWWCLPELLFTVHSAELPFEPFRVTGVVTLESFGKAYRGQTNRTDFRQTDFTITMPSRATWIMRLVPSADKTDYCEIGTDGYRIYQVRTYRQSLIAAKRRGLPLPANEAGLLIHEGPRPSMWAGWEAVALWVAFCSMQYFDNLERASINAIQPVLSSDVDTYYHLAPIYFPSEWARETRPPGCVLSLVQKNDGYRYYYRDPDLSPLVEPIQRSPWPPPYDRGFTNLVYNVRRLESLGRLWLPAEFECLYFRPVLVRPNTDPGVPGLELRLTGRVSAWEAVLSAAGTLPIVPGTSAVSDFRFFTRSNRFPHLPYMTNRWLSDTEVMALREYRQAVSTLQSAHLNVAATPPKPIAGARALVWAAMILVSLICLAYACKQVLQRNP
jgi:hypothetical protein